MVPREDLAKPPAGLTSAEARVWREIAGAAIKQGTLVASTRPGFRELVEIVALKEELKTEWRRARGANADRLYRRYQQLSGRVETTLARFLLTGRGRAEEGEAPESANPWAEIAGRQPAPDVREVEP